MLTSKLNIINAAESSLDLPILCVTISLLIFFFNGDLSGDLHFCLGRIISNFH